MEIKVLEVGKDFAKLLIKGEDHTFLNLLQHYLVEDKNVVFAKYHISHPLNPEAELYVKTVDAAPLEVIKRANEKIVEDCDQLLGQI
ncbi:MAG: DNA-directed RNA polymerase subunit L [Archaeoglobales archaeon]|nr:DNA-directed RNA polymerase subunit L [Archaeoglobales archaeon]